MTKEELKKATVDELIKTLNYYGYDSYYSDYREKVIEEIRTRLMTPKQAAREAIMKLQTYKLFEDGELLVCRDDVLRALEQETILDKIRAEIKTKYDGIPWRNNDYDDGWIEALEWVFDDVIDKYKAESEEI